MQENRTTIETLPINILVQVAKYLPITQWPDLERVNRTFRDTVWETWRKIRRIRLDENLLTGNSGKWNASRKTNLVLEKLVRRAVNIADIGGFEEGSLNQTSIDLLVQFEKVERIQLGRQYWSLGDLEKFLKESASREKLKEVNASESLEQETPPGEQPLFEAFHEQTGLVPLKLETFDLSKNILLPLSWSFLNAVDVSRLTSFLVINNHVNRSLLGSFLERAANLETIAFSIDCYSDEEPWDEPRLHAKEAKESQLVLQLNKEIIRAVGNLDRLVSLRMNTFVARFDCGCRNFEVEMAEMFGELGRRGTLKELSLLPDLTTPAMLNSVAATLPNLRCLELGSDDCIQNSGILRAQKSLVNLRVLRGRDRTHGGPIVPHIMVNALHLESLHLKYFNWMIRKGELLQIATFKQLKELSMYMTSNIDDEVLAAWADGFGLKLELLEIPQCRQVTDEGLLALNMKAPRLRDLDVSDAKITDRCLKEIATQCREIRKLDLSFCRSITVEGVQALVDGCFYLKRLRIAGKFPWFPDGLKIGKYQKILLLVGQ